LILEQPSKGAAFAAWLVRRQLSKNTSKTVVFGGCMGQGIKKFKKN
jgi:hypothetical protein